MLSRHVNVSGVVVVERVPCSSALLSLLVSVYKLSLPSLHIKYIEDVRLRQLVLWNVDGNRCDNVSNFWSRYISFFSDGHRWGRRQRSVRRRP